MSVCADSPEHSLLAYTKSGCREVSALTPVGTSSYALIWGICAYGISIKILCADPYRRSYMRACVLLNSLIEFGKLDEKMRLGQALFGFSQ